MYAVSPRFLAALGASHDLKSVCTYTVPNGSPTPLVVSSGSITGDASQMIRRGGSLKLVGTQSDFAAITTPGTVVNIQHGIDYGASQTELVPVFCGEIVQAVQNIGDGTISVSQMADLMNWIARVPFANAIYSPSSTTRIIDAISYIVTSARPNTNVVVTSTNTSPIGSQLVFSGARTDAIATLAKDANLDCHFDVQGNFVIADMPTIASSPAWQVTQIVESAQRTRPLDKLYNAVLVKPAQTNGTQTWAPQLVQITDTTNPRHPNYIGLVVYEYASPTPLTAQGAVAVGNALLQRVVGTVETLALGLLSNPALDLNDIMRITLPSVGQDPANTYQHITDTLSLDLSTGSMSLGTRSQSGLATPA